MKRKDFLKAFGLLGISVPISGFSLLRGPVIEKGDFSGDVLIIGAGAAGMSAAYLLEQQGLIIK